MVVLFLLDGDPEVVFTVCTAEFFFGDFVIIGLVLIGGWGGGKEEKGEFVLSRGINGEGVVGGPLWVPGCFDGDRLRGEGL